MKDRLAVTAAEQLGTRLGPRAGLRALDALIDGLGAPAERARAIFLALDWALELGDGAAIDAQLRRWRAQPPGGAHRRALARACARLRRRGFAEKAWALADAECERAPRDGRAFYLRARCAEDAEAARTDLQRAAMLGEERGDASLVAGARARLARRGVGQAGEEPLEVLALAPRERLAALAAKLQTKGRYGRVTALDGLIELAAQEEPSDPEVARAARRLAARHADAEGRLTPIEIDRVRTLLRGWPDAAERELALGRLAARDAVLQEAEGAASDAPAASDAIRRARAVLEHGSAGPPKGAPTPTWRALELVAAARREEPLLDRAEALDAAVRASRPAVTAPLLTAAWIARRSRDERTAVAGERIATRLAGLAEGVAPEALPTRGWLRLADAVSDAPLAAALLSFAVAAREPGAEDRRAEALVRRGWEAFRAGDEEGALEALRAARALVEG